MKKKSNGWSIIGAIGAIAYVAYKERQRDKIFQQNNQRQQAYPQQPIQKPQPVKHTKEELQKVYYGLAKKYHPDYAQNEQDKQFRGSLFVKIKNAYESGDMQTLKMFDLD
jgi:hypothetical protein